MEAFGPYDLYEEVVVWVAMEGRERVRWADPEVAAVLLGGAAWALDWVW